MRKPATISTLIKNKFGINCRVSGADFFERDTVEFTKSLLGCFVVNIIKNEAGESEILGGRIVEAEAYIGENDPACHAARGRTPVTDVLYRRGGTVYIYLIYGMYDCLNFVGHPAGGVGAALIRAVEPLFGIESMLARRGFSGVDQHARKIRELCSGPGKLCRAMGIDRELNGTDYTAGPILVLKSDEPAPGIGIGPRVGINKAADWPLRFWVAGSPWVSGKPLP